MPDTTTKNPEQNQQTTEASGESLFNEPNPEDLNEGTSSPAEEEGGFQPPDDPEVASREDSTSNQEETQTQNETEDESQIDSEGSTEPEGEPQSEEEDPASDSGADTDSDATSEQEGDEASEEADTEDSDSVFFDGEHSMYESKEDALEGIEEKDDYIMQLQNQLDEVESETTERVQSLQSEKQELEREVEQLRSAVDNDTVEELAMQDYLPERFQGKTEADFADDEELVEFKQAKLDAKAQYRREQEQEEKRQQQIQEQIQEQHEQAREWVEENVSAEEFGATSPERQAKLENYLYEEEGEYSRIQKVQFITAAFGEADGKRFLNGLQDDFRGSRLAGSTTKTSSDTPHKGSQSKSEDEEVAEQVKKSKPSPESPDEKPRTRSNSMDDRSEMEQAFRRSADEKGLL